MSKVDYRHSVTSNYS